MYNLSSSCVDLLSKYKQDGMTYDIPAHDADMKTADPQNHALEINSLIQLQILRHWAMKLTKNC